MTGAEKRIVNLMKAELPAKLVIHESQKYRSTTVFLLSDSWETRTTEAVLYRLAASGIIEAEKLTGTDGKTYWDFPNELTFKVSA